MWHGQHESKFLSPATIVEKLLTPLAKETIGITWFLANQRLFGKSLWLVARKFVMAFPQN